MRRVRAPGAPFAMVLPSIATTGTAAPVVTIDGQTIGEGVPGPLTRRIRELYAAKSGSKKP